MVTKQHSPTNRRPAGMIQRTGRNTKIEGTLKNPEIIGGGSTNAKIQLINPYTPRITKNVVMIPAFPVGENTAPCRHSTRSVLCKSPLGYHSGIFYPNQIVDACVKAGNAPIFSTHSVVIA